MTLLYSYLKQIKNVSLISLFSKIRFILAQEGVKPSANPDDKQNGGN